jgi:phenylacetate-coenzyme A ligase PaaK-like adenylate-forming protein
MPPTATAPTTQPSAPAVPASASGPAPTIEAKAKKAREALDAHVRDIVGWHFNPDTGCPFWLAKQTEWKLDVRKEVGSYDDLKKLPHFEDDWLRGGPVRRWLPRGLEGKPVYVFETGGSTGVPKSRLQVDDWKIDYENFSTTLSDKTFPKGSDWLMLGPSGPRRLRLAIEHLAQVRGGIAFSVDLDPRWVVKCLKRGEMQEGNLYKQHAVDQALTILRANPNIKCMFTTPKLLEALCEKIDIIRYGITGIFCGGTELTPQFHRFVREELAPGADFIPTYGNTLMGLATHKPFDPKDNYEIIYHAPQPRAVTEVVNPKNADEKVGYGEVGRVMLTTLTKETFIPRFLERDQAIRRPPCEPYPWDGTGNVQPFQQLGVSVVEGVY